MFTITTTTGIQWGSPRETLAEAMAHRMACQVAAPAVAFAILDADGYIVSTREQAAEMQRLVAA